MTNLTYEQYIKNVKTRLGIELCSACGQEFAKINKRQHLCKECIAKQLPTPWIAEPRMCDSCNKIFMPNTIHQIYCGYGCRINKNKYFVFLRDGFSCIYCGESPIRNPETVLEVEHVIPKSKGGEDRMSNLVTSCRQCNGSKTSDKLPQSLQNEILSEIERRNKNSGIDGKIHIGKERVSPTNTR